MDKSKENVLMCEKAVEIQRNYDKQIKIGDVVYYEDDLLTGIVVGLNHPSYIKDKTYEVRISSINGWFKSYDLIFLPRQDQLQKMCINNLEQNQFQRWFLQGVTGYKFDREECISYPDSEEHQYYTQFTSMEQLWLAFLMKAKFNKIWNGKDWR